jgi:O-methyltransferase
MGIRDKIRFAWNNGLRFTAVRILARLIYPELRLRYNSQDWLNDRAFNEYLELFAETRGINSGRRWMVYQLLRATQEVPGDTAECGVFQGATSYIICAFAEAARLARTHHAFDSFEGLSEPTAIDGRHWRKHDLACGLESVQRRLGRFSRIRYHKGWIPDCFPEVDGLSFSFVHIDVDIYEPTRDSVAFFYSRLSPGGILVCDDYGFATCPGATKAVDDFLRDKPEKMIALSDGGGFIIKGRPVADRYAIAPAGAVSAGA